MENRLQRRPRSTSMKDRQNSKAQSDRTSSMESECSPDSRLIAQVCPKCIALFLEMKIGQELIHGSLRRKNKISICIAVH